MALLQALKEAAASGDLPSAEWGAGAEATGHAHVVSGWATLGLEAKVALVEDLLQVAVLTGQLQQLKVGGCWFGGVEHQRFAAQHKVHFAGCSVCARAAPSGRH